MVGKRSPIKRLNLCFALVALASGLFVTGTISGCQPPDDGIPAGEKKNLDRLNAMAKSSGGDFDKLSAEDKDYLVKEIAHGDENSARMILGTKAGTLGKRPGGGAPGGPPR